MQEDGVEDALDEYPAAAAVVHAKMLSLIPCSIHALLKRQSRMATVSHRCEVRVGLQR